MTRELRAFCMLLTVSSVTLTTSCSGIFDHAPLPPTGQIVLGVASDAWLPRGAGDAFEPVPRNPLFERLRIELFAPGEATPCAECFRDFGIDHRTMNEGRASIGFVPRAGVGGYRARVRLYHSGASESSAEPRPSSTLETVVALPVVAPDGVIEVHVTLRTDELTRPKGTLEAPAEPEKGPATSGLAGTWHEEVLRDCGEPARSGEACVPGGAFWFGDVAFAEPYERLVAVSPFYVDLHEATVAEVRASGLAFLDPVMLKADPYLYSADVTKMIHYCTYTQSAGTQEDLPVNCVTKELATKLCAKRGGQLLTEAQFEFVSGARRDATFPWGEAVASCTDAVYGRAYDKTVPPEFRACTTLGVGAAKPGSGVLDRVRMPDGNEIVDLAGNLAEWTLDIYQRTDEPCYLANPVVDPVCRETTAASADKVGVRGNAWTYPGGSSLRAALKASTGAAAPQNPRVGFRCARSAP